MPLTRWLDENGLSSVKIVLNLAQLVNYGNSYKYDTVVQSRSSLLYVTAPGWDSYGMNYGNNVPISNVNDSTKEEVGKMLLHVCTLRQCPYNLKPIKDVESNTYRSSEQPLRVNTSDEHTAEHIKREVKEISETNSAMFYPLIMDSVYSTFDEEFADVHFVESLLLP